VVAVFVYTADKIGRDAGEICDIGPIGIMATGERDEVLALDADCALYMAQGDANPKVALTDICDLLASGKNVVSTALTPLIYPASIGYQVVERLQQACAEGSTTFHATGIEPGGRRRCCHSRCRAYSDGSTPSWSRSTLIIQATTTASCSLT
jgi:hypothetical protein